METITKIEIKKSMYCNEIFYSLYIDNKLHKNYNTINQAKRGVIKLLQFITKP